MDKEYWEKYYKEARLITAPSQFAVFVVENFSLSGNLIELGCGNGRDTAYFASHGLNVLGIDQCNNSVNRLNELNIVNAKFEKDDFTNLNSQRKFDNIYSRFTLHSVNVESERRTIKWAAKAINGGFFAIEVRSTKDDFFGKGKLIKKNTWFTDHARRFVDFKEIKDTLIKNGFSIIFEKESRGLAPYRNEDPVVIRIIAKK